uniref:putative PEP-binding protein n=1 Tax=Thaumasiovibrio occultus TaxID=1891184 RepID=UPI00131DB3C9|nr:putative PEP-binding protein [Thaumasiovibrio occultus]
MTSQSNTDIQFLTQYPSLSEDSSQASALVNVEVLAAQAIGIHPAAFSLFDQLSAPVRAEIEQKAAVFGGDWKAFYVETLLEQIIGQHQDGADCRLLLMDVPLDQMAFLVGALGYQERNPELGLRGVARLQHPHYRQVFELQCELIKRCQQAFGAEKVKAVFPFVRTLSECASLIDMLAEQGLCRGYCGFEIYLKADLPANLISAQTFLQYVDGMVIDTDRVAQFAQGLDIDHPDLTYLYDEQNDAVLELLANGIAACQKVDKPCLVLNRQIAKSPRMQAWLLEQGIEAVIC